MKRRKRPLTYGEQVQMYWENKFMADGEMDPYIPVRLHNGQIVHVLFQSKGALDAWNN